MPNIIVVGPHPDDQELGMGATIALLADQGHDVLLLDAHLTGEIEVPVLLGSSGTHDVEPGQIAATGAAPTGAAVRS